MTPPLKPSTSIETLINYVESLTRRLAKAEANLNDDIQRLETRLIQFCDVLDTVSSLQRQLIEYQNSIGEDRSELQADLSTLNSTMEKVEKEQQNIISMINHKVNHIRKLDQGFKDNTDKSVNKISRTVSSLKLIAIGGVFVSFILSIILFSMARYSVETTRESIKDLQEAKERSELRLERIESKNP